MFIASCADPSQSNIADQRSGLQLLELIENYTSHRFQAMEGYKAEQTVKDKEGNTFDLKSLQIERSKDFLNYRRKQKEDLDELRN